MDNFSSDFVSATAVVAGLRGKAEGYDTGSVKAEALFALENANESFSGSSSKPAGTERELAKSKAPPNTTAVSSSTSSASTTSTLSTISVGSAMVTITPHLGQRTLFPASESQRSKSDHSSK
jgi:hypothetical protein